MSKSKEVHTVYKAANGAHVMISGDLQKLFTAFKLKAEDLWKVKPGIALCINDIPCKFFCIQLMDIVGPALLEKCILNEVTCKGHQIEIMREVFQEEAFHSIVDLSYVDDICICPEDCLGLIRTFEDGIVFQNLGVHLSFKELAKKISPDKKKAFGQMLDAIKKELG